ncbi:murein hydrolase regulator LrgA [Carnobacterium divergens]|uniref:CidA/LrgA family protein n=1 Tax=Carnobacterium divergens TaxID=2748 RepID=UPI001072EA6A|nr:CidA/LrgA family protein [Carnobacterium divergens]MDT1996529.1 CidA/LrgA family protein [Carnobacterium divergens]TFI62864.1 murein hydrolase regulator LrgA [Carnobacterium divergens]TFI63216.1 murein hydrolase regulator LrgA [Carnobacterium divergens]TFI66612.1 murein hydrolase regulator LrgA [Carnobacterium divergens]TFI78209.1 murein hydrolase regulator LrgA [Carnobacterium divergens]
MDIYKQLLYILSFSFLGEVLSKVFALPIPGSVIGMLLLFLALQFKLLKVKDVETVGGFLLGNLSILFLPAGVGIMVYFPVIKDTWWLLLIISLLTTAFTIGFVGLIVQGVKRKFEDNSVDLPKDRKDDAKSVSRTYK